MGRYRICCSDATACTPSLNPLSLWCKHTSWHGEIAALLNNDDAALFPHAQNNHPRQADRCFRFFSWKAVTGSRIAIPEDSFSVLFTFTDMICLSLFRPAYSKHTSTHIHTHPMTVIHCELLCWNRPWLWRKAIFSVCWALEEYVSLGFIFYPLSYPFYLGNHIACTLILQPCNQVIHICAP